MICKECVVLGEESQVLVGNSLTTLMHCFPYYDKKGVYHMHDTNKTTNYYSCSNGHNWFSSSNPQCPNCEWPNE